VRILCGLTRFRRTIASAAAADAVAVAMDGFDPRTVRAVRIRDTAHLAELWVSEALLGEVADHPALEQARALHDVPWDA
jgi:predicted pyridoxine 5'-phosphate oxidase superfamily flavin-nucleotide-binding protein